MSEDHGAALNTNDMREFRHLASFALTVAMCFSAFSAPREKAATPSVRPLSVAAETKAELVRYALKAYVNRDATNVVKGLLFMPKPGGSVFGVGLGLTCGRFGEDLRAIEQEDL